MTWHRPGGTRNPTVRRRALLRLLLFSAILLVATATRAEQWGWAYLENKLVADGVRRERVVAVFDDPRVEPFGGLDFAPGRHREAKSMYRGFLRASTIAAARHCRQAYAEAFERAADRYGVSADALAALIYVESGCGRNTGSSRVFNRLARLAMANDPDNLRRNLDRFSDVDGRLDPETAAQLREKARYLEQTFYPEVRAVFEVADRMGVDPLEIRGSGSGAFGYPQFLPSSYLNYGVDGDGDGRVSLYDADDAAASCAHYLSAYGWHAGSSKIERRAAVWQYNHSDAYVDAVLTLATRIGQPAPPPHKASKAKAKSKAKAVKSAKAAKKKH